LNNYNQLKTTMTNHYLKVAKLLLEQNKPITIEKLSITSNIPTSELKLIIKFLNDNNFMKYGQNLTKIQLKDNTK
jgi:predicted transcriptional regulator